jgi:hypothetical protein
VNKRPKLAYSGLGDRGRLGNQLHQVAATVGLARARGYEPQFPADWEYRPYFSCPDKWFGTIQPRTTQAETLAPHLDRRCRPYLQDISLWENVADEIWDAFQPSDVALDVVLDELATEFADVVYPIAAVHVRRGDYATNPDGTITSLPPEWYLRAAETLNPGTTVVFSDDIAWCREQFGSKFDRYYTGIPRLKEQDPDYHTAPVLDWVDVFLQAECEQHVISNSTYSWWGAWLSRDEAPRYPSRWYGSDLSYIDAGLMIPDGWVEVPVEE